MKTPHKAVFLSLATLAAPFAEAAGVEGKQRQTVTDNQRFNVGVFTGVLNNRATERVFYDGQRLSQLNWRTKAAPVLGADFRFCLDDRWSFEATAWTKVKSGNTRMTDYDWLGRDAGINEWTDYSRHPGTALKRAYSIDARAAYTFASTDTLSFKALAGYRFKKLAWHAGKGSFIYSEGEDEDLFSPEDFRNIAGDITDTGGIKYSQRWRAPYLGLGGEYQQGRLTLSGELTGSFLARGTDRDDHVDRNYVSGMRGGNSKMISASLNADYALSQRVSLFAKVSYEKYYEIKGKMKGHEMGEPVVSRSSMSNRSMLLNVGATYHF